MSKQKRLQDLTIKDNFMFAAVMSEGDNCRRLLEMVLGCEIKDVTVVKEKSIIHNPEYKGVRLDVCAKDENNTHFNVEMQVANRKIFKRSRYYHSHIDMDLLISGTDYEKLPNSYVIFICDFDPFGLEKYRYFVRKCIEEDPDTIYDDGSYTLFLSTKGKNRDEVPKELAAFLDFVAGKYTDDNEPEDAFVRKCMKTIEDIKKSREMGARYMLFEEMMKDEFRAGLAEGISKGKSEMILELLKELGTVDPKLEAYIMSVNDPDVQSKMHKKAARAVSLEDFMSEIGFN